MLIVNVDIFYKKDKEVSLWHKLWFSDEYIFATQCRRVQSMRSNILGMKYQSFTSFGSKDIRIQKFEYLAKTQFLYLNFKSLS